MKKIIISESSLPLLKSCQEEVTFYKFFNELKEFIKSLLNDPLNAKVNDFFKNHGISRSVLINRMLEKNILTKKESINEPYDDNGNQQSRHTLEYKVVKKNFERKMRRLYSYFFESKVNEHIIPKRISSCATYIFCFNDNGELCVLGGKRGVDAEEGGKFNVPTGLLGDKIENRNESPLECAVREVTEETGMDISKSKFKCVGNELWTDKNGQPKLGKNFFVMLNGTTDDNKTDVGDGENSKFIWIPISKVDQYQWAFGMNNNIKKMVRYANQ